MPYAIHEFQDAYKAYQQFLARNPPAHSFRCIFSFFAGSYFAYRKIDIERVAAIANSVSENPSFVDIGCGYGDFLEKVRMLVPDSTGIEKEGSIFYAFRVSKPDYIQLMPVEGLCEPVDVAFVGWIEPGQDFRRFVALCVRCVIAT